jgi:hypothetical protein
MEQYKQENGYRYDSTHFQYNFVKVECTSTFPRLTFIVKFLPVLQGISMIYVYSQKKLSRINDAESTITVHKNYKEIEIVYGSELRNTSNIEFRFTEPKKLKEIERFLIEFLTYTNNMNKLELFFHPNHEIKYFDSSLICIIDEIINMNKNASIDLIISKINSKFYENYINGGELDKVKVLEKFGNHMINNYGNDNISRTESIQDSSMRRVNNGTNSDIATNMNINPGFLQITRDFILREIFMNNSNNVMLFNQNSEEKSEIKFPENTLMLSKMDESQYIPTNANKGEYEPSIMFNMTNKFSDISRLEDDEKASYYNHPRLSGIVGLNKAEASFDIILTEIERQKSSTQLHKQTSTAEANYISNNNLLMQQGIKMSSNVNFGKEEAINNIKRNEEFGSPDNRHIPTQGSLGRRFSPIKLKTSRKASQSPNLQSGSRIGSLNKDKENQGKGDGKEITKSLIKLQKSMNQIERLRSTSANQRPEFFKSQSLNPLSKLDNQQSQNTQQNQLTNQIQYLPHKESDKSVSNTIKNKIHAINSSRSKNEIILNYEPIKLIKNAEDDEYLGAVNPFNQIEFHKQSLDNVYMKDELQQVSSNNSRMNNKIMINNKVENVDSQKRQSIRSSNQLEGRILLNAYGQNDMPSNIETARLQYQQPNLISGHKYSVGANFEVNDYNTFRPPSQK